MACVDRTGEERLLLKSAFLGVSGCSMNGDEGVSDIAPLGYYDDCGPVVLVGVSVMLVVEIKVPERRCPSNRPYVTLMHLPSTTS